MRWQDVVFASGSILFAIALVPALRSPSKPPRSTSFLTASVLSVYVVAQVSLGLFCAAASGVALVALWTTLGVQAPRDPSPK